MRLASMLLIAACLTLSVHADGKPGRAQAAGPGPSAPAPLDRQTERLAPAKSAPIGHETETYRFGATYAARPGTTVEACEATCGEDLACKAWSFVDAYGSADARCELKRSAGRAEENLLSTSGLSPAFKAHYLGTPQAPDPVDRDQLLSDADAVAAPKDIHLMASVPVLTYSPVQAPVAAAQTTAGIRLPMTQPSITFTPVMTAPAALALRYATAAPEANAADGATVFYPNSQPDDAEAGATGYYPPQTVEAAPSS